MPDDIYGQKSFDEVAQLGSKLLFESWFLVDKMLPDQLGPIRDGLKRHYSRSGRGTELPTNFIMFQCIAGILYRDGTLTMGELSQATAIPRSTATRMIQWMVDNGYVDRFRDRKDGRIVRVRLTDSGTELFLAATVQLKEFAVEFLERLPAVQRTAVVLVLTDIVSTWQNIQNGAK
jgi:DNA-binding MarR family transcriptional regulator